MQTNNIGSIKKRDIKMIELAAYFATKQKDLRVFSLGAAGIRNDGTVVISRNGPTNIGRDRTNKAESWHAHAEARLAKKLDVGATVYVVRVVPSGTWKNAKPCDSCIKLLKRKGVKKIVYTSSDNIIVSELI